MISFNYRHSDVHTREILVEKKSRGKLQNFHIPHSAWEEFSKNIPLITFKDSMYLTEKLIEYLAQNIFSPLCGSEKYEILKHVDNINLTVYHSIIIDKYVFTISEGLIFNTFSTRFNPHDFRQIIDSLWHSKSLYNRNSSLSDSGRSLRNSNLFQI